MSASLILIGFSDNLFMLLVSSLFYAFGYGTCQTLLQSLCIKNVDDNQRSAGILVFYYGTNIGFFIGPVFAGKILEVSSYSLMFKLLGIIMLVATGFVPSLKKQSKRKMEFQQ